MVLRGGFITDLDGNNVECVCHWPPLVLFMVSWLALVCFVGLRVTTLISLIASLGNFRREFIRYWGLYTAVFVLLLFPVEIRESVNVCWSLKAICDVEEETV